MGGKNQEKPCTETENQNKMEEEEASPDGAIIDERSKDDDIQRKRKRRRCWGIAIVTLLVISGIVAAVLILVVFKDPDEPQSYSEYQEDLLLALRGEDSYLESLSADSPHGKALTWMRTRDTGFNVDTTPPNQLLERYIMALFYYSTDGPNWKHQAEFLSEKNICDWFRSPTEYLTCHNSNELTDIYFFNNSLSGPIPTEVGLLRSLWDFQLPRNNLVGSIPWQFGLLNRLTSLHLHGNALTGNIPDDFGNLANLKFLELDDNALSGPIPTEIGSMTSLTSLFLGKNELTGRIPDEIGRLSNATEIYLQFNELSGMIPTAMNQLTGLRSLYLNDNAMLTGSLEGLCSSVTSPLTAGSDCLDGMVQCSCCDNC